MKLDVAELAAVLGILDKIDNGVADPRIPGPVGRFLRQYRDSRINLRQHLYAHSITRRADGAVSGIALGKVTLHSLLDADVSVLNFPLGEVADTLAFSEELGGLTYVVMWLKGAKANAAYNALKADHAVTLSGDYRWTPISRVTTGGAFITQAAPTAHWRTARCLKAVAEDLLRPPHATEFVLDYRIGRPGLKHFRCVCAKRDGGKWNVLPALTTPHTLVVVEVLPEAKGALTRDLSSLLIYTEPWAKGWIVADSAPVAPEDALSHSLTWIDFQRELAGHPFEMRIVRDVVRRFRAMGIYVASPREINLTRSLLPVPRDVLRWLRGER